MDMHNTHAETGGVSVAPTPITYGDHVTVIYNGLLADQGADQVWLHAGYGGHLDWQNISDYPMLSTGRGWERTFQVTNDTRLNFCFKDSASNWDNNTGINWSMEVHNGQL